MPKTGVFNLDILPEVIGVSKEDKDAKLSQQRQVLLEHWRKDPWNWLMGEDLEEREVRPGLWTKRIIWTTDERDPIEPIKAFPNFEFLYRWVKLLNDFSIKELLANKPRQVLFSTATLLWMDWLGRFWPSRALLLSKNTEDQAKKMLKEKVRDVHERLPQWVKEALPMSGTPEHRADYKKSRSRFYAVPENAAHRHAVGGTASILLIDEAALQDMFQTIWAKAAPMASKLVGITTAQFGTKGANDYRAMMGEKEIPPMLVPELLNPGCPWPEMNKPVEFYEARISQPLQGFRVRKTARGFTVVDIALEADPTKRDAEVLAELERRQPSYREFKREYRGDWTSPAGGAYYSEFDIYGGREAYQHECTGLIPGVAIGRGWDFGRLNPCITFAQRDPFTGRIWILRMLRMPGADTYVLRDVCMVVSGQLQLDQLSEKSSALVFQYLDALSGDPRLPPWPWFEVGTPFLDFSSREALRTTPTVEGENEAVYDAEVLSARGIFLTPLPVGVAARETMVRKQLKPMEDGLPGLLIDPACPEIVEMFDGGLVYAEGTKSDPQPNKVKRDGKYHDLNDSTGYVIVGLNENVSDQRVSPIGELIPMKTGIIRPPRQKTPWKPPPRPSVFLRPGQHPLGKKARRDVYSR